MQQESHTNAAVAARSGSLARSPDGARRGAFTMLEVMVACAIFFMVAFALLDLVTRGLVAVRAIQKREPDPGIILAMFSTNKAWEEVTISGNYEDIAPDMYPGYRWELFARRYMETNQHLFIVDVMSYGEGKSGRGPSTASTIFFSPNSKPPSGLGGLK